MSERLWSGEGCADNPEFELVKRSSDGVPLYRKVKIAKRARALAEGGGDADMGLVALEKAITKALDEMGDDDAEVALIKAQLRARTITPARVAAEMMIEGKAAEIRKGAIARGEQISPEQAYVRAIEDPANAALVRALD
jgi:hypothetical protein